MTSIALALEFLISALLFPKFIKYMKKLKLGQYIRQEGPNLHNYKEGTPTAGGIVFISVAVIGALILRQPIELILTLVLYGFIGFIDDFVSIFKKRSLGLKAWQKLVLQFSFSAWIAYRLLGHYRTSTVFGLNVPEWLFYIFVMFLVSGYSNATNLTDGIDGLAGWVFVSSVIPFSILNKDIQGTMFIVIPVLAFLLFNSRPATVFMGDTGSLALGAYISTYSLIKGQELALLFFTSIFLLETLSVILQVGSYKLRGKRVFLMAPIHHHFEMKKWTEEKIVGVFTVWNLAISLITLSFFSK